jgi:hypothetical protein
MGNALVFLAGIATGISLTILVDWTLTKIVATRGGFLR